MHGHERKKREKKKRGYFGIIAPVRELRHAEHGLHGIERVFEKRAARAMREVHGAMQSVASAWAQAIAMAIARGGPLIVTIGVTVELEDMEDLPDESVTDLQGDIHEILENASVNTVTESKSIVPVRTGRLRDSISGTVDDELLMVTFQADTGYAIYVEDGTSRMAPSPYLREPAAEAEVELNESIDNAIASRLDGNIDGDEDMVDLEFEGEIEVVEDFVP